MSLLAVEYEFNYIIFRPMDIFLMSMIGHEQIIHPRFFQNEKKGKKPMSLMLFLFFQLKIVHLLNL